MLIVYTYFWSNLRVDNIIGIMLIRKKTSILNLTLNYFLFRNLKSWCVVNRINCWLVCMDDKAKIPIGDPGSPEAATQHMNRALSTNKVTLEASDHNYHSCNLTPSVNLLIKDIPESPNESFYTGQPWVGIKDSIFEASNPLRHIVELITVLRSENYEFPPYLSLFSDGGGDHNITFLYVQCCLLALFVIGDFDVLNVGRCAPNQSFINPAERCMSLLNNGLQGLSLERDHTGPFEGVLKSCSTMKSIQIKATEQQGLRLVHDIYRASQDIGRIFIQRSTTEGYSCQDLHTVRKRY